MRAPPIVTFMLGKPAARSSLLPTLFARLAESGITTSVMLPHREPGFDPRSLLAAELVVQRGLRAEVLAELEPIEQAGVRFCNRIAPSRLVLDRERLSRRLGAAGLPVPAAVRAADWPAAREVAGARDVVIKTIHGDSGRGAGVAFVRGDRWPAEAPLAGPLLVEPLIPNDGLDRKLYVAGSVCRGLLKPWPRDASTPSEPFAPDAGLAALADSVGAALDLDIFGVDVVLGAAGPVIVDVNLFPSFNGFPDAAGLIAAHLRCVSGLDRPTSG